jgi:hypothetical protein
MLSNFNIDIGSTLEPTVVTITARYAGNTYSVDLLVLPNRAYLPMLQQ